jgi:zinc protease
MFIPTAKPERAEIPRLKDDEISAMVKEYKGDAEVAQGEVFDPSPANIESRLKRSKIGGLDVAMLAKENRGDSVVANITLRFGDEQSLMNRSPAARFVGHLLERGSTKHTRQQIQDEFDRLKAQVWMFGGPTNANVIIETTRQNLPSVLRLVGEVLREKTFPQNEFDQAKLEALTGIESQKSEPASMAFTELGQHFNIHPKGHPLYSSSIEESIAETKAVTLDEVKKFYKDCYGASSGQMTVVGDFDEKEVTAAAKEVFGNWKSAQAFTRIKTEYASIAAVNKALEAPDKANAFLVGRMNLKMRDDHPDYPAVLLANYMFGGSGLSSRLSARIRGKEGLSYGVGSQFSASSLDETGSFLVNGIYAPENGDKFEAALKEELAKLVKDGFTAEEVVAAKSGWLQGRQLSRSQDRELSGRLTNYLFLGRTLAWDADLESKVNALTAEQINAAIRKHIVPENITIIKAGDFAKLKAKASL